MAIWFTVAVWAGSYLLSRWLRPDEKKQERARALRLAEFEIPRAEEGAVVPIFWGRVLVRSPLCVWTGGFDPDPQPDGSFRYHMSMHLILGIPGGGGEFGGGQSQLHDMLIDDVSLEDFNGMGPGSDIAVVGGAEYGGRIVFHEGSFDQNATTAATIWEVCGENPDLFVPYRGQAWVMLTGYEFPSSGETHWFVGYDSLVPPYAFEVSSIGVDVDLWSHGEPDPIDDGQGHSDANPADVLWDLLTNAWSRAGISKDLFDAQSFRDAAETLADEGHGCSVLLYSIEETADVVWSLIEQIDAVFYYNPTTGLYTLRLVRDDYDIEDLPVFDQTNVIELADYTANLFEETYNEVRVRYTSRALGYKTRPAFAQNGAHIAANNGRIRRVVVDYPYCTNHTQAAKLAARELQLRSQPFARMRLVVNRDGYTLNPGDAFVFSWPDEPAITGMVMRVVDANVGTLDDRRVVVDCVQDQFADYTVFLEEEAPVLAPSSPTPVDAFVGTEAPRWLQLQAYGTGQINSTDIQRAWYLAAAGDGDINYRGQLAEDEVLFSNDTPHLSFPGGATTAATYDREDEPYDTSTGLTIENLTGWTPANATVEEIAAGANLILVGGEIMAFETATDLGGGTWLLEDVWRGLLDTVPVDHAIGERVYRVHPNQLLKIGEAGLELADSVAVRIIPRSTSSALPFEEAEVETFTVRTRTALPYPPADMVLDGSKIPPPLEAEGMAVGWTPRKYTNPEILRGDDLPENLLDGTTYNILGRKGDDPDQLIVNTVEEIQDLPLGLIGHGQVTIGVQAERDGLTAWQVPEIDVYLYRWRSMLLNPTMSSDDIAPTYWTVVSGDNVVSDSGSSGLGGTGSWAESDGASVNVEFYQVINVAGYLPERLRAILDFYAEMQTADANDTLTVDLIAMDAADIYLSTDTYGPATPINGQWDHLAIDVANLPADTAKLKVNIVFTAVGGGDPDANIAVTSFTLRLGQISDQLLLNPDFEAGIAADTPDDWDLIAGGFQLLTANPYSGAQYIQPIDGASAGLEQTVAIPDGFQFSDAVLSFSVMANAADDTIFVAIRTLDSGMGLIDQEDYGPSAPTPLNIWQRKRLVIDTTNAAYIQIALVGIRVTGTPLNVCWDDFDLRIHKQLDLAVETELDFSAPAVQLLPTNEAEWAAAFPAVTTPDYGIFDGSSYDGTEGSEVDMMSEVGVEVGAKFVGCWDGESIVTTAFEFVQADDADVRAASNAGYGAFDSSDSFTVMLVLRCDEEDFSTARGLCGRIGATGWSLEISAAGVGVAKLIGDGGTKTATGTTVLTDGATHYVALRYDAAGDTLMLIDEAGHHSTSTATGLGEISLVTTAKFRIGRAEATQDTITGQIARVYLWTSAIAAADIDSLWTHGTDPSGELTVVRTGEVLAAQVGTDDDGVLLARFHAGQVVVGHAAALGYGLLVNDETPTLVPSTFLDNATHWVTATGTTVTRRAADGPEGFTNAVSIEGTSAHRLELTPISLVTHPVNVVFWARAATAVTMRVSLTTSGGVVKDTETFVLTTEWAQYTSTLSFDGATPTGKVYFHPSDTGSSQTIFLSGPVFAAQDDRIPVAFPVSHDGTPGEVTETLITCVPAALTEQFNSEGEIRVRGVLSEAAPSSAATLVDAYNGTNDNDRRTIAVQADADAELTHYDGAAAGDSSVLTAFDWSDPWELRARWCRAGLLEQASAFAGLRLQDSVTDDYGRVAAWTPSAVALDEFHIGHTADTDGDIPNALFQTITITTREARLLAGDLA